MEAYFYVLHSEKLKRFYSGVTTLGVQDRFESHLKKVYGKSNFTQKADDWTIFLTIRCKDFSQARRIELHVKKMKSSKYIQNLKNYPELVEKILEKFS